MYDIDMNKLSTWSDILKVSDIIYDRNELNIAQKPKIKAKRKF